MSAYQQADTAAPPRRRGIFYGWVMVWAAFAVMLVGFGAAYSFPAFFNSLQGEFQVDRGATSTIFGIAGSLYFFLGAWSGPAGDRIGARPVVIFGTIVCALGLVFAATASRIEQVYWGYGLGVGVGVGCMYVPTVGAVQRWFARRRATASGLAIMGIGFGTFLAPLISEPLIEDFGWRNAYLVLAAGVLGIGVLCGYLLENSPAARGLYPDGADAPPTGVGSGPSMTFRQARGTLPFWLIYFGALFISFGLFVPFVHLVKYAQDLGMTEQQGVLITSSIGVGSIVGRALLGPVAVALGRQPVMVALYLGLAGMFIFWLFSDSLWMLLVFGFVFGTLYGGFVALAPTLITDYYGVGHAGSILGKVYSSVGFGALLGAPAAGYLFDLNRSYDVPILGGAALCILAAGCLLVMPGPAAWREKHFGERF